MTEATAILFVRLPFSFVSPSPAPSLPRRTERAAFRANVRLRVYLHTLSGARERSSGYSTKKYGLHITHTERGQRRGGDLRCVELRALSSVLGKAAHLIYPVDSPDTMNITTNTLPSLRLSKDSRDWDFLRQFSRRKRRRTILDRGLVYVG